MNQEEDLLDPAFLKRLEYLDFVAKKITGGEFRGERLASTPGHAVEFREHKTFAPGDDIRYVDWNVYMRLDELYLKEFEAEESLSVALVVDASASMDFGRINKIAYARRMAAAIGYVALSHFDSLCVTSHPMNGTRPFALRGKGRRPEMLRRIAAMGPSGPGKLADTVKAVPRPKRGALLMCIVSDFYDEEGFEKALRAASIRKAHVLAIHVVDQDELEPKLTGSVRLVDVETGRERVVELDDDLLARYKREFDLHLKRVERYCVDAEFGFARVDTSVRFDAAALSILRKGRILR